MALNEKLQKLNRKICKIKSKTGEKKLTDCMFNHHGQKTNETFIQSKLFDEALETVMQVDQVTLIDDFINSQKQALQVKDFKIEDSCQKIEALEK